MTTETQIAEIELLMAAYDSSELTVDPKFDILLSRLESRKSESFRSTTTTTTSTTSISITLSHNTTIQFWLSPQYPDEDIPQLSIRSTQLSNTVQQSLSVLLNQKLEELKHCCCLFDVIQTAKDYLASLNESSRGEGSCLSSGESRQQLQVVSIQLMQVLLYFHHIKSPAKKREIVTHASELQLGGFWKEGFPGIILCEGECENVKEYIRRLQTLRWQHMVVRGERVIEIPNDGLSSLDNLRQLPKILEEVDNMSSLGQLCKEYGVHDLFMTSMKVFKS